MCTVLVVDQFGAMALLQWEVGCCVDQPRYCMDTLESYLKIEEE